MLITNAMICDHQTTKQADLRIKDGVIEDIQSHLKPQGNEEIFDAKQHLLLPALIDLHVSPRDKNLTSKNLTRLAQAARMGGVGSIALLPNSQPRIDSEESVEFINSIQQSFNLNIYPIAYGTKQDGTLTDLSILKKKGCKAIFVESSLNGNLMRRICEYSLFLDMPMICHCEDATLRGNGVMNDSLLSAKLGLPGIPALSEVKEVAKMGEVAVFMQNHILFASLSSQRSITLLERYKQENKYITTECSIHHLALNEELCDNYNTAAKILPPLKSQNTCQKLIQALQEGKIHHLTSLHSASNIIKKDLAFEEAAFGVEALGDYFSLLYTFLIHTQYISMNDLMRYASYHPANFLGLNKGEIAIGKDADLILVDTHTKRVIDNPLSPYHQQTLYGEVKDYFIGGVHS